MMPPPPHTPTTSCLSPFLRAIRYWMGGGYELSNPKGNVPRRQLPNEKWPFRGCACAWVLVFMCRCLCVLAWRSRGRPAGFLRLLTKNTQICSTTMDVGCDWCWSLLMLDVCKRLMWQTLNQLSIIHSFETISALSTVSDFFVDRQFPCEVVGGCWSHSSLHRALS